MGVLGGLGPQATMDFERRVHEISQRQIAQVAGSGYPPMVVYYCRFPPILLDENGRPAVPVQPNPQLLEAAERLGRMADFLVITANAPHYFEREIARAAGLELLSMIDLTLAELKDRNWGKVGVLGLGEPLVYLGRLEDMGAEWATIEGESRDALDKAIFKVMEGGAGESERSAAEAAVEALRSQGVDGVILGCTEIPLLLSGVDDAADLINPGQLLAEAAVKYARR
jgi:aspartate racemase